MSLPIALSPTQLLRSADTVGQPLETSLRRGPNRTERDTTSIGHVFLRLFIYINPYLI